VDLAGGLIGQSNGGLIIDCYSIGNISGTNRTGGLIGQNHDGVNNSYFIGNVTGVNDLGGLVGLNQDGIIYDCWAVCTVSGTSSIGGLVGRSNGGMIDYCYTDGEVIGTSSQIGGIIGTGQSIETINNSYSYCTATGTSSVGGFAGSYSGDINLSFSEGDVTGSGNNVSGFIGYFGDGIINNTYATGLATGNINVGGFIGYNDLGKIYNSYSVGMVSGNSNIGGFIGNQLNTMESCFYDNITSNQNTGVGSGTSNGLLGLNTSTMMERVTFTGANWDFEAIWGLVEGKTYPIFLMFYFEPYIVTQNISSATEDDPYVYDIKANYSSFPEANNITWNLTTNSSGWLTIDVNGTLIGIPGNDNVGIYWVNVTVIDLIGRNDSINVSLTVFNINDAPEILTETLESAYEDQLYSFVISGQDIDPTDDELNWSFTSDADDWLHVNNATGELYGTPNNEEVDNYWVNVTVEDSNYASTYKLFSLTVFNTNDHPVINLSGIVTSAVEDEYYNTSFSASDPDPTGDTFTWSIHSDANWLQLNGTTGVLNGTPLNEDADENFWINISVIDGFGGIDSENFTVWVNNVNDPPIITTSSLMSATEDVLYQFQIIAEDLDPTEDILSWNLSTNASWLIFNSSSGQLFGTPSNDETGMFYLDVSVNDGLGGSDNMNFTLIAKNINDPPIIINDGSEIAKVGVLYTVNYTAIDIDPVLENFTWILSTNASWLTINASTGLLSGKPKYVDVGRYWANVSVNDGYGGFDWKNFTINVTPGDFINEDPVISTNNKVIAEIGKFYYVDYNATDDRTFGENLVWSIETNASVWLKFDGSTGVLSGTPGILDKGIHWVEITVTDGDGGLASTIFTLIVQPPPGNNKPKLRDGKFEPDSGNTDTEFIFSVVYTDLDNDAGNVMVWIDGDQYNMTPDLSDKVYSDGVKYFYKTQLEEGTHSYYFTADDGFVSAVRENDDNTPTSPDTSETTPKIEDVSTEKVVNQFVMYLLFILILIVIFGLAGYALSKGRKIAAKEEAQRKAGRTKDEPVEEEKYECPDCATLVTAEEPICPGCGLDFEAKELEDEFDDDDLEEELDDSDLDDEEFIEDGLEEDELKELEE